MTDKVKVKTVDGVDIVMDPETGRFEATFGCNCTPRQLEYGHAPYACKRKTVTRKTLGEVEREIGESTEPAPTPVKGIRISAWRGDFEVVVVIGAESAGKHSHPRYRAFNGQLFSQGTDIRVFDAAVLKEIEERKKSLDWAQKRYDESVAKLEPLTREKLRELQRAAAGEGQS